MSRVVSVWLPAWPIDRLRRALQRGGCAIPWEAIFREDGSGPGSGREVAFALVESGVHGLTLTAVNAAAWRDGVRPGATLADARAALPALLTGPAEIERDRVGLAALAGWAGRYGPRRHAEGADGLWIDITGVPHLFGGEARLAADLHGRLTRSGIVARVAIADTPGAAFALARFATLRAKPVRIAGPGDAAAALREVPVDGLRLPPETVQLLKRLGLKRIGQLYALPREALAQRFRSGSTARAATRKREREAQLSAGLVLMRLDQALGRAAEPRRALEEPPVHCVERLFAEPLIVAEGVAAALDALGLDLEACLAARAEGATRFTLGLYRVDNTAQHVTIGASRPCRSAAHLSALLAEKLQSLDAGFGIDAMTLSADLVEPLSETQIVLDRGQQAAGADAAAVLIDRLSNRLGAHRVVRLRPAASHIPERAERCVPALAAAIGQVPGAGGPNRTRAVEPAPPQCGPLALRPPLLLSPPEPITVLAQVPEGAPLRFCWRRITRRVVRADGPERIAPEWWRAIGGAAHAGPATLLSAHLTRTRDYYRIEDDIGGRYWVFRAGLYGGEEGEEGEEVEEVEEVEEEEGASEDGAADDAQVALRAPVWFIHGLFG